MKIKKIKEIRAAARRQLAGCWCECTCSLMLFAGIVAAVGLAWIVVMRYLYTFGYIGFGISEIIEKAPVGFYLVSGVAALLIAILLMPLKYAVCWYYAQAAEDRYVPAECFFSCYKNAKHFKQTTAMGVLVWVCKLPGLIAVAAVGFLCTVIYKNTVKADYGTLAENIILTLLILVMVLSVIAYVTFSMRFRLVPFVYAAFPDKPVFEVIKLSTEYTKGSAVYLTQTLFSFVPWLVLCVMVFPLLYVVPYMFMTFTAAANKVIWDKAGERSMELPRNGENSKNHASV
jgi:hypothetical protein